VIVKLGQLGDDHTGLIRPVDAGQFIMLVKYGFDLLPPLLNFAFKYLTVMRGCIVDDQNRSLANVRHKFVCGSNYFLRIECAFKHFVMQFAVGTHHSGHAQSKQPGQEYEMNNIKN
jgi:hypothetical protein